MVRLGRLPLLVTASAGYKSFAELLLGDGAAEIMEDIRVRRSKIEKSCIAPRSIVGLLFRPNQA